MREKGRIQWVKRKESYFEKEMHAQIYRRAV